MEKLRYYIIIVFIVNMCNISLLSQNNYTGNDTLKGETMFIFKEFNPTISPATKIDKEAKIKKIEIPTIHTKYNTQIPKKAHVKLKVKTINPAVIKGEFLKRFYRGYLKFGFGNYNTFLTNIYLNNLRSRNWIYGFNLNYNGSTGQLKNIESSTNDIYKNTRIFFKKNISKFQLSSDIYYNKKNMNYYGLQIDSIKPHLSENFIKKSKSQFYESVGGNIEIKSFYKDSFQINFQAKAKINSLKDNFKGVENNIIISTNINRYFNKDFVNLNIKYDINKYKTQGLVQNNNITEINPQMYFKGNKWMIDIGLINVINNSKEKTSFNFYPKALLKYSIANNLLIPYIGLKGGIQRQSYNSLKDKNPFINPYIKLKNKNERYNFYGGIRGAYNTTLAFNISYSISQISNQAMFVNFNSVELQKNLLLFPEIGYNTFNIVYDTIIQNYFLFELSYTEIKRLKILLQAKYYKYTAKKEAQVWHMPTNKGKISLMYNIQNKIYFTFDIFYLSKQYARTFIASEGEQVRDGVYAKELKGITDINLGIEYQFSKKFFMYFQLNNIASIEYQKYNNYPTQKFNFLFGFNYSFWGE